MKTADTQENGKTALESLCAVLPKDKFAARLTAMMAQAFMNGMAAGQILTGSGQRWPDYPRGAQNRVIHEKGPVAQGFEETNPASRGKPTPTAF